MYISHGFTIYKIFPRHLEQAEYYDVVARKTGWCRCISSRVPSSSITIISNKLDENLKLIEVMQVSATIRNGPFDIQGVWDFFEKIVHFHTGEKKNFFNKVKSKKNVFFIQ